MATDEATVARIDALLEEVFLLDDRERALDLVESGLLDSLDFTRLLQELEDRFDIAIGANDLSVERFRTRERIAEFVAEKRRILNVEA